MARILAVDDEESIRFTFERFLRAKGHEVHTAASLEEALGEAAEAIPDLIVADIILEDGTGIDLLREVRERGLSCPVIMITGDPSVDTAAEAVRLGAFDYIPKPVTERMLLQVVGNSLKYKALNDEKERYRSNLEAIFRSVKDSIVTMDKDSRIIAMSDAALSTCGMSRADIGKKFKEVVRGCNGKCVEYLEEAIRRKDWIEANRIKCESGEGSVRIVNLSAYPLLGPHDAFDGIVMVFRDETLLVNLEKELTYSRQFHGLVGRSSGMQKVYSLIEALSNTQTTVLITGESGTGKELVAEALHCEGERSDKPLVKVNCSALPESLLESELFGHVKGSFTGALHDRVGRFQRPHGGIIFLDEVGDLSSKIQIELLRVLQEREFERVGDSTPVKVDVRVITATNKNLREKVRLGEFREDLYYRLKVVEIAVPPLRDRRDDIPLLVEYFIKKFNSIFSKTITGVSSDVRDIFLEYAWPGNVRELEHTMEHAFVMCRGNTIDIDHLSQEILSTPRHANHCLGFGKEDDSCRILEALEKTGWNKAKTARLLGISRATLYRKMQRYKIPNGFLGD